MASKINKILFFFILLTGISFPQLIKNCGNELPSDNSSYEKYLNCKSKSGYDDYFIGDVKSQGKKLLDKNIFDTPFHEIHNANVQVTIFNGEIAYSR